MKYITQGRGTTQTHHKTMKQYIETNKIINALQPGLCGDDPLAMIRLPQRSHSSQSLGKYWQLSQNNQLKL